MNRFVQTLSAILVITVSFVFLGAPCEASRQAQGVQESLAKGESAFAAQMYHQLGGAKEGNLFFSPYSISAALGMVYAGARGKTAQEIKTALSFQVNQSGLGLAFKGLNKELTDAAHKTQQKLNIANALVLTGGNVSLSYKNMLKEDYEAEFFSGGLEVINSWVARKTEGKIEKILENLNPNSICVILNAVYFKGIWESRFPKAGTREAPFTVSPKQVVRVPLMHQKGSFRLLPDDGFEAVSLPYKGKGLSMVVFLPNEGTGLAAFEKKLGPTNLKDWLEKLDRQEPQNMNLYLPRFTFETGYDLVSPFKRLGMKEAFGPGADFGGMGWGKGAIWIGQVKHKAFVDVNEEGTEAAAATAVEMITKAMRQDPEFRADHPFVFVIRDNHSGAILFMGRVVDPTRK